MHLYLQLTRSLAVTLIWLYCNKLVLRYVRLRVSDLGQVSIPQPGIVTHHIGCEQFFHCQSKRGQVLSSQVISSLGMHSLATQTSSKGHFF